MSKPTLPSLAELLEAGAHFGHQASKWHPKMAPFIFGERNGIHILDLEKTQEKLKEALEAAENMAAEGKNILFVGTKHQAKNVVKKYAEVCEMPYVNERWIGGMLTNFPVIYKLFQKYRDLQGKVVATEGMYTKKERLIFSREIAKLDTMIGGIKSLEKSPDAVFIIDVKREMTAFDEAKSKGITIFAFCDTNINPTGVDYVIPANDDAVKSIELITRLFAEAVAEGKKRAPEKPVKLSREERPAKVPQKPAEKDEVKEADAAKPAEASEIKKEEEAKPAEAKPKRAPRKLTKKTETEATTETPKEEISKE